MQTDYTKLDAMIASLGLEYSAQFVPFSLSRNAVSAPRLRDLSLNWRIAISKGGVTLTTDYQAGIAHIPGYKHEQRPTGDYADAVERACETGQTGALVRRPVPAPALRDVLYCLVQDADAIDYPCFEEWAHALGFDTDSRKAERTYNASLDIALKLRAMFGRFGEDTLAALREAYQDY
jgi:hypothetical protein